MVSNSERDFEADWADDDLYEKHEINYDERFKAVGNDLKKTKAGVFDNEDDVQDFLNRYEDIANKSAAKVRGNLLHKLIDVVEHNDIEPRHVELLVRRMVQRWPALLKDVNKDDYNPVFMAIRNSQHELVNYMISACTDGDCLDSALSHQAQEGKTCIHIAFTEKLDPDTTKKLVECASDEALAVQDDHGKTAMHYAVSFRQWWSSFNEWSSQGVDARSGLIALFIDRDLKSRQSSVRPQPTFLDLRTKVYARSVYTEHQHTREIFIKKYEAFLARQREEEAAKAQAETNAAKPPVRTTTRDPRARGREVRSIGSTEPSGDHSIEKPRDNGDADDGLDERERIRRRKKAEEARKKAEETKSLSNGETIKFEVRAPENARGRERTTTGRESSRVRAARAVESSTERTAPMNEDHGVDNAARQHEPAPNTPIKRRSTAHFHTNSDQERKGEIGQMGPPPRPGPTNDTHKMTQLIRNSDAFLLRLKQHYMRTRSAEMAISFLYGNNMEDIQISFDYDRLPQRMLWNDFIKRFGADATNGLKFDRVLQYVTFPHVEVILKGVEADRKRETEPQEVGLRGRRDMLYFFDWLYKKGVRHIIRVSVQDSSDSGEKVHSDRAIQECLEKFVVEQLDWKKVDLDPETILHVSSKAVKEIITPENQPKTEILPDRQLQQLYLRWSGSNAVLRAWSEPQGLAMLPHLSKIYLFTPPDDKRIDTKKKYDSETWINDRVVAFKNRLNASCQAARALVQTEVQPDHALANGLRAFEPVEVILTDPATDDERNVTSSDAAHMTASAPVKGVNSHRWLDSTSRFAGQMIHFWKDTVKNYLDSRPNLRTPEGPENDVTIALVDDGVDRFDIPHTSQILEGKSFEFHNGKVRPPFSSTQGHGTVMASMILRVCPMVKIYPIRLKTYPTAEGKNMKIDAGYAAQAIQAALDKKATIISMSWTIPMAEGESEAKDRLHNVLKTAVERDVLMFCSTPDTGKFTDLDYPSGPWRDRFFRIGAANADGTVFQWTPEDGITYVLPGVDVVREQAANSSFDAHSTQGILRRMVEFHETGSSVATALAAGLAAMIIYCVKASILAVKTANRKDLHLPGTFPDHAAELIAHPNEMNRAFASLGRVTANQFIQVWDELDKLSQQLEASRAPGATVEVKQAGIDTFVNFGQKLLSAAQNA